MATKKLWSFLRVGFFMTRKGLISKRKLMLDMSLYMKRGKSLLGNLNFLHHHNNMTSGDVSPNPVFFHTKRRHHTYFPCMSVEEPISEESPRKQLPRIEYSPSSPFSSLKELAAGESMISPLPSPMSVRFSNYSNEEEGGSKVDEAAEEFIRLFYEQLSAEQG